jgi:hypothetical protein
MGQRCIEILIGSLVTDEELRWRFVAEPREIIRREQLHGFELTVVEVDALLASFVALWEPLVAVLDFRF